MMRVRTLIVGCLVVTVALVASPLASAKGFSFLFDGRASHGFGYTFSISAKSASITVGKSFKGGGKVASYGPRRPPRMLTRKGFKVDFGRFGKVRVRYEDKPGIQGCNSPTGTVHGVISFEGEDGYTKVDSKSAPATLSPYNCTGFRPEPDSKLPDTSSLLACDREQGLRYIAYEDGGSVYHTAESFEKPGRLRIFRQNFASGKPNSFTRASDLSSAAVNPGGPISGGATFADGRLTGNLRTTFLGIANPVALTPAKAGLTVNSKGQLPTNCPQPFR